MAKRFKFAEQLRAFKRLKRTMARKTAANTRRFFLQSFRSQGWLDNILSPWEKRKAKKDTRPGRAILVDSANLRGSIRVKSVSFPISRIGSYNIRYNRFHNRGAGPLPKRQFIGSSRTLTKSNSKIINLELSKLLQMR